MAAKQALFAGEVQAPAVAGGIITTAVVALVDLVISTAMMHRASA